MTRRLRVALRCVNRKVTGSHRLPGFATPVCTHCGFPAVTGVGVRHLSGHPVTSGTGFPIIEFLVDHLA